jgi:hypothetical protein
MPGGRPPCPIRYVPVTYSGTEYMVAFINHAHFVFDAEDADKIRAFRSWHVTATQYISTTVTHEEKRKALYLHNLVLDRPLFGGKGQVETVDHINQNGFDNRKENLRICTQTEQNINQHKKPRVVVLPEDCSINPDDIPRHIWYVRANGAHGDRFAIEFKSENLVWKGTSSKMVSLRDKLHQAKEKLEELYTLYPHLNPDNPAIVAQKTALTKSYEEIVAAALEKLELTTPASTP